MGCCASRPEAPPIKSKSSQPANLVSKPLGDSTQILLPKREPELIKVESTKIFEKKETPQVLDEPLPELQKDPEVINEPEVQKEPEPEKFECSNGHTYAWHTDTPFIYAKNGDSWNIFCEKCSNSFSKAGWHCRKCSADLCDTCALKFDKHPQNLFCENSHPLFWSPETSGLYKELCGFPGFVCKKCKQLIKEPGWNCDICNYDLCINCGIEAGFNPPINLIVCSEGHNLVFDAHIIEKYEKEHFSPKCDVCKTEISIEGCYHCDTDDYDLCVKCSKTIISHLIAHPGFRCQQNKEMVLIELQSKREETGEEIKCLNCDKDNHENGYFCDDCLQSYCLQCSRVIYRGILTSHEKKCSAGHGLNWVPYPKYESKMFRCNVCTDVFKTGCFSCDECNFDVCIKDIQNHR